MCRSLFDSGHDLVADLRAACSSADWCLDVHNEGLGVVPRPSSSLRPVVSAPRLVAVLLTQS